MSFIWTALTPSAPQMCYFPEDTSSHLAISHVIGRWSIVSSPIPICARGPWSGWQGPPTAFVQDIGGWLSEPNCSRSLYKTTVSLGIFKNPSRYFYFFFNSLSPTILLWKISKCKVKKFLQGTLSTIYIILLCLLYHITLHHLSLSLSTSLSAK